MFFYSAVTFTVALFEQNQLHMKFWTNFLAPLGTNNMTNQRTVEMSIYN